MADARLEFDHLVYGVPHLLDGVRQFTIAFGVEPVQGGRHLGRGTANYLVGLGDSAYLEIIGPDPEAPDPGQPRWFGVGADRRPGLLTWCVRTDDLDGSIAVARNAGYDPGDTKEMSRRAGNGELLQWRLTPDTIKDTGGTVPFLIDWGRSRHPTANDMPRVDLAAFTLDSPDPGQLGQQLTMLGLSPVVTHAERPGLHAVLDTPQGTVELC